MSDVLSPGRLPDHINDRPVRVRFAPSPTGFLHIGGVRTALFNWLYAKQKKGKFLLRIEDTDLERSEARYTQDFLASLEWLGLTWDEEPIYQSQRLDLYRQKANQLVEEGYAYRCYCTEAEVEVMREQAIKEGKKPHYDRRCRNRDDRPQGIPHVIRLKTPEEGFVEFEDLIRGTIRFNNEDLDDFVLIRSNSAPTYNLSVVVDDVDTRISHIMRGDDHINNTPKQVHLYNFFNYPVPKFAHLPMILGPDKKKLSKRHGAVSANVYRADGYLPEALLNFLARLGWSHGDQEIFSIDEMVQYFSFDHVQKASAVFNFEKLLWLNGSHIRATKPERLLLVCIEDFADFFSEEALARVKTKLGLELITLIQPKVKTVKELAQQLVPLCTVGSLEVDPSELSWNKDPSMKVATKAAVKHMVEDLNKRGSEIIFKSRDPVDRVWGRIPSLRDQGMGHTDVDTYLRQVASTHGIKLGDFAQPIRLVLTGRMASAGLFELLSILPWDTVEARLKKIETL